QGTSPTISAATTVDNQLFVDGENFASGAKLFVNGIRVKARADEMTPDKRLIINKVSRRLPVDEIVALQGRNPDGQTSTAMSFYTGLILTYESTPLTAGAVQMHVGRKFLIHFSDRDIRWIVSLPPTRPAIKFFQASDAIVHSDGIWLARHPG